MNIITHVKMDLERRGMTPVFYAVQGDINTRFIELELYNGSDSWTPPSGTTYMVQYKGPNGYGSYETMDDGTQAVTVTGNVMTVKIAPQVLEEDGRVIVVVCMTNKSSGQVLHTYHMIGLISTNASRNTDIFTVTTNLSNIKTNASLTATGGDSYRATLTANTGYTLDGAQVSVTMGGIDITSTAYSNGVVYIPEVTGNISITASAVKLSVTTWSVTFNLENITSSVGNLAIVDNGSRFVATLTVNDGYSLNSSGITVTMGGVNVTSSVVNGTTITIPSVTGDVVVTAVAEEIKTWRVVTELAFLTSDQPTDTRVENGKRFTARLTADTGYTLDGAQVSVVMGNQDITETAYEDGVVQIESVTADVVIRANAIEVPASSYTVEMYLTGLTSDMGTHCVVTHGESFVAELIPEDGYTLDGAQVDITMGEEVITDAVWFDGMIQIGAVTGDVIISAIAQEAEPSTYSVTYNLQNVTSSNRTTSVAAGDGYYTELYVSTGYVLSEVKTYMGGEDVTDLYRDGNAIDIPSVTGDVSISATGVLQSTDPIAPIVSVTVFTSNCSCSVPDGASFKSGDSLTGFLTADEGYSMAGATVTITMGYEDITDAVYDPEIGQFFIASLTQDVKITAFTNTVTV